MWFQIIPGYLIVTAGVAVPGYITYFLYGYVLGNHNRRSLLDRWERHMYQRDLRLTGNPYKVNGLELIKPFELTEEEKERRVTPDGKPYPPKAPIVPKGSKK